MSVNILSNSEPLTEPFTLGTDYSCSRAVNTARKHGCWVYYRRHGRCWRMVKRCLRTPVNTACRPCSRPANTDVRN